MNETGPQSTPQYTLTELCQFSSITPPLMKKIQMKLNLGSGKKIGERTYYSEEQARIYRMVKALRVAGVEFKEIVALHKLEEKIRRYENSKENYDLLGGDGSAWEGTLFHFILSPAEEITISDTESMSKKTQDMFEEHKIYQQRIMKKCKEVTRTMTGLEEHIKEKVGKKR